MLHISEDITKVYPPDIEEGYDHLKFWLRIHPNCSEDEKIRQFWLKMFGDSKYSYYKSTFYAWYEKANMKQKNFLTPVEITAIKQEQDISTINFIRDLIKKSLSSARLEFYLGSTAGDLGDYLDVINISTNETLREELKKVVG